MKRILFLTLIVVCWLSSALKTQAQSVYGDSWLEYDPATNSIRAVAYSEPDYSVQVYYCVGVQMRVWQGENYIGSYGAWNINESGWPTGCTGLAWVEQFFPYDPNSEYFIETDHSVEDVQVPQQTEYYDPYGFYTYMDGMPVYYPLYYNFMGTGSPSGQSLTYIFLGVTYSLFTAGAAAGPPHHLWVWTDRNSVRTDICGQAEKEIDFQVVDSLNRPAGRISIDEKPVSGLTDSCSNKQVSLTSCSDSGVSRHGDFTDVLRTGCPWVGPSNCGFSFGNTWRWCRRGGPYYYDSVDLAWMFYDVRRGYVKVDNQEDMTDNTNKYP